MYPTIKPQKIFALIIFVSFGVVIGLVSKIESEEIISGFITLFTAFSGAFFAFKLNNYRESARIKEQRAESANKVIYSLIQAYNFLEGFRKQFIAPVKDSPASYVEIRPALGSKNLNFKIDYSSISFLIIERKSEILTEINELEDLCSTLSEVLNERNNIHVNFVQPAMDKAGFIQGDPITLSDLDNALGVQITQVMKSLTNSLIDLVENGATSSDKLITKMHEINKKLFPEFNIIHMIKTG